MSSAREEAERLVAAALGMASETARNLGATRSGERRFANGSDECCICPVCRTIAAMREPDPHFAERLATGAGDLAAAVSNILRSFAGAAGGGSTAPGSSAPGSSAPGPAEPGPAEPGPAEPGPAATAPPPPTGQASGDAWRAATRGTAPPPSPKPMAKKAVKKAVKKAAPPTPPAGTEPTGTEPTDTEPTDVEATDTGPEG